MKYIVLIVAAFLLIPAADSLNRYIRGGGTYRRDDGLLDRMAAAIARRRRDRSERQANNADSDNTKNTK